MSDITKIRLEQESDPYEHLAVNLEGYIERFIPKGWEEPISKAAGVPYVTGEDARMLTKMFTEGSLEPGIDSYKGGKFSRHYFKAAIISYFSAGQHKKFVSSS